MTIPCPDPVRTRWHPAVILPALLAAAAGMQVPAASADPLASDSCRSAIAALDGEESRAAAAPPLPRPSLQDARQRVAVLCLASRADAGPQPARRARTPIVVEPVAAPATRAAGPALPSAPIVPLSPRRPDAVVSCDAGGCWADDGTRLQRVGPDLWGPRGICTLQGASLQCPTRGR